MKGYFQYEPSKAFPLGHLGKIEHCMAYMYKPEDDTWERWEYGDAIQWGQGPWDRCDDISDDEGDFLKYKLQVAEELTHMFGNSYRHDEENFKCVLENEYYVRERFDAGATANDTAAEIGYSCG